MTLNLIETFKLTACIIKHTQQIQIHFQASNFFKNVFSKIRHLFESAFPAHFDGQAGNYLFNCFRCFVFRLLSDLTIH